MKTTEKEAIKIRVNIVPGPISPAQKVACSKFWQKLIAEVNAEVENAKG